MKTIVTNLALAALGFIAVACFMYIALYLVAVGALIGLAYAGIYAVARLYRWYDDRAHQRFIDSCIDEIAAKRPASARIDIR